MADYAQLTDSVVTNVIVAEQDFIDTLPDADSYIVLSDGAGIGDTYDAVNNVFIKPQPFDSWILNAEFIWESPVPYPNDGKRYVWNEDTTLWELIEENT